MSHPFGDLLRQYRARKANLSQTRLANLAGYDNAILVRMCQGKKDLTGPSGRERVVRVITALRDEGALTKLGQANALLKAAGMPALFDGQPAELALIKTLQAEDTAQVAGISGTPAHPHRVTNLPAQLSTFIGREHEIAEVKRLLATTRLLTLTGSGGAGKTRLAIEAGASFVGATLAVASAFSDGVWLVEFAALAESRLVADSVATTLGLQAMSRTAPEVLADYLSDKKTLLILDNCEHLLQGCAELAVALLQACPQLHLLVTSREPLNVPGERTWRVPPMALEEAAHLFEERARAANPDFVLTSANTEFVAQICRRLDDMPLALELAAARLRAFSVEQVASRLDDAFRMLTGGSRIALPRQQTLRATIDWSYELLANEERTLLRELSVFAGGWTLEAAEAIHGTGAPELLEQLVNKSLVVAEQRAEEKPVGTRYRMLETIRQYAHEKLTSMGEDVERHVRQLHLAYYTDLSKAAESHSVSGPGEKKWAELLSADTDNARAALSWAAKCGAWQAVTEGARFFVFFLIDHGYGNEVRRSVEAAILSNPQASDTARVMGLHYLAFALMGEGDMSGCVDWYRKASALAHRLQDEELILHMDAQLGFVTPDDTEAVELLQQVIDRGRRAGWKHVEDGPMTDLGQRMGWRGDYSQATQLLEQCITSIRQTGDRGRLAYPLWRFGQVLLVRTEYARARAVLEESVALYRESGWNRTEPLVDLGTAAVYTGDYTLPREALSVCFMLHYKSDNLERVAQGLVLAAGLAQALGNLHEAARLLGAAVAIRRDHHTHGVFERELFAEYDRRLPAVRAAMNPTDFDAAWAAGQRLTIKAAIAEALAV